MDFFGLNFSSEGIKLKQSKADAIMNAKKPENAKELKSFQGLVNYAAKFIPDVASLFTPFRDLLKRNSKWYWDAQHDKMFDQIKNLLSTKAMAYFNTQWSTEVTTDASPSGVSAILSQYDPQNPSNKHIVVYASRALTPVEMRYSQVEREALAVVWACEKLKIYLIGREFDLIVDNKAIQLIFGNPKAKTCARLERWALRLIPFSFRIRHEPGSTNIADYLSRNSAFDLIQQSSEKSSENYVEDYINMIIDQHLPPSIRLDAIIQTSREDPILQAVRHMIIHNERPLDSSLQPYYNIRQDLSINSDGVILYQNRVIIPASLQREIVNIGHEAHQSAEKTKQLLNQFVWFPGINRLVDTVVRSCRVCAINSEKKQLEPLKPSQLPPGAWQHLATDFHGPLSDGQYFMVILDEYSRFPIVKLIRSTAATHVIPVLAETFNLFGKPSQLKTDNGPPFQSHDFQQYLRQMDISHLKITPYWPRANGIIERFMRNLNKVLRNSKAGHTNWKVDLDIFLRNYRNTPHESTGVTPASLLFKTSSISLRLPYIRHQQADTLDHTARLNDKAAKLKIKYYFDKRYRVKQHTFQVGDTVLLSQQFDVYNKSKPRRELELYTITNINHSMITARNSLHQITRNSSCFKQYLQTEPVLTEKTSHPAGHQNRRIPFCLVDDGPILPKSTCSPVRTSQVMLDDSRTQMEEEENIEDEEEKDVEEDQEVEEEAEKDIEEQEIEEEEAEKDIEEEVGGYVFEKTVEDDEDGSAKDMKLYKKDKEATEEVNDTFINASGRYPRRKRSTPKYYTIKRNNKKSKRL